MTELALPPGWSSKRLKNLATYNDEVLGENTDEEKEIDYVEISGVSLSHGIEEIERMTFGQAPSRARRKVRSGDVLISTVRTYLRAIAKVDEASDDLIASTGFCVVRPNDDADSGFLGWAVQSEPFVSEVVARSVGVSYPAINATELVTIDVPRPPLDTQQRIARFLDEKTARIDGLIEKKWELLDRLAEKRQALITRAVTKGLNPDVPIKPSGIDWLGEIPVHSQAIAPAPSGRVGHHAAPRGDRRPPRGACGMTELALPPGWSSKRLKNLATYNDEVLGENTDEEKEIDYVEISGVSLSHGIEEIERMTFGQAPSRARRKVRSGDILISTVRTYLRAIAKVNEASDDLIASTGFCIVRPNDDTDSGFLGWAVQSEPFVSEVVARSVGVSYPAINATELVTIDVPRPPLDTQRRIARFLDQKTARIDATRKQILCSIESLSEYRSALITTAVTGQLADLR